MDLALGIIAGVVAVAALVGAGVFVYWNSKTIKSLDSKMKDMK